MAEVVLKIDGMHCGSCIRRVTHAINAAGGAGEFQAREVRLGAARLKTPQGESVAMPESESVNPGSLQPVIAALAKAGFTARVDS